MKKVKSLVSYGIILFRALVNFGFRDGIRMFSHYRTWIKSHGKTDVKNTKLIKVNSKRYGNIYLRTNTTDVLLAMSLLGINGKSEYEFGIEGLLSDVKYIIDAGANIGLFSLMYAHKFPGAQIIAIEPEKDNYKVLRKNTENCHNIHCVKAGVWNKDCYLNVISHDTDTDGVNSLAFTVQEVPEDTRTDDSVKAISIESIMKKYDLPRIDILKMDIEGSEKEVFSSNYESWADKVNMVIIELHDNIKDGCTDAVEQLVRKYGLEKSLRSGEDYIFYK